MKTLSYEEIEKISIHNQTALFLYFSRGICGDCLGKNSFIVLSREREVFYNLCEYCYQSEPYMHCNKKLNEQELFVLRLILGA